MKLQIHLTSPDSIIQNFVFELLTLKIYICMMCCFYTIFKKMFNAIGITVWHI